MHPLERLVNLVALLLESRTPLTFDQIRSKLAEGYGHQDASSAKRMFERDKDVLRDIGVPIDVVSTDAWDVEHGYTIDKDRYYLPEIAFTPEELSALFVAVRSAGDVSAEEAVRKLLSGADRGILAGLGPPGRSPARPTRTCPGRPRRSRRDVACASRTGRHEASARTAPWMRSGWRSAGDTGTSSAWIWTGRRSVRSASHGSRTTSRSRGRGPSPPTVSARPNTSRPGPGGRAMPRRPRPSRSRPTSRGGRRRGSRGRTRSEPGRTAGSRSACLVAGGGARSRGSSRSDPTPRSLEPPELRSEILGRLEEILAVLRAVGARARPARPREGVRTAAAAARRSVPYLVRNQGTRVAEAAELFGMSEPELLADLDLLFVSGLPPYGPGDLIDVDIQDGRIWIGMADYFARPLRLTRSEALAIYLRGTVLAGAPGLEEAPALASALGKLADALGPETLGGLPERVDSAGERTDAGHARRAPPRGLGAGAPADRVLRGLRGGDHRARDRPRGGLLRDRELVRGGVGPPLELRAPVPCRPDPRRGGHGEAVRAAGPPGRGQAPVHARRGRRPRDRPPAARGPMGGRVLRDLDARSSSGTAAWRSSSPPGRLEWLERLLLRLWPDAEVVDPPGLHERVRELAGRTRERYG